MSGKKQTREHKFEQEKTLLKRESRCLIQQIYQL